MHMNDIYGNAQFSAFLKLLEAKGVTLRYMWQGRTTDSESQFKYPDLTAFQVIGKVRPSIATIVVRDYGENGFGLWIDPEKNNLAELAALIA